MKENKSFIRGISCNGENYKYVRPNTGGVYFIVHDITKQYYIGKSNDISTRLSHHFSNLKRNKHGNHRLQELYNKSNYELFSFYYIKINSEEERCNMELDLLNLCDGDPLILNSATKNNSWVLNNANSETVDKWKEKVRVIASNKTGNKNPFYGKHHSDETKEKLRKLKTGSSSPNCQKHVVINGVCYDTLEISSLSTGLGISTIAHRVRSNKPLFINWYYLDTLNEVKIIDERLLFPIQMKRPTGLYKIEGKTYFSTADITKDYNMRNNTLMWRLNSNNFQDWIRIL